ncbi:hypothetical protein BT96DRAFT_1027555 [Gymnopus androsaceus JB14]|uniref:Uncharacterized protein n=1 Tax=Gymnopus androsaceus JB14 TaxID=1447944 RepID=A0A6A4GB96_9AGAR|nr:hypothetical protein BT96DRAFT_1027555 [Gymnopus androsaceus JB14]
MSTVGSKFTSDFQLVRSCLSPVFTPLEPLFFAGRILHMHISARGVTAVASASAEDGGATAGVSDGNGDGNGDEGNDDGNGDEGNDDGNGDGKGVSDTSASSTTSSQTSALSSFMTHLASNENTSPLSPTTSTSAGGTRARLFR